MWFGIVRNILQLIGLAVVIWITVIAVEEYLKIRRRVRKENGQG